jgi:hypothetical protein
MIRWILWTVVSSIALSSQTGMAAVISHDWKIPGDGLLTYDDVNQREWLDLTESRLSRFPGATFEQRYQNALLELAPGGMFADFNAANRTDLLALAQSAGIDPNVTSYVANHPATANLIALVGRSFGPTANGGVASFGLLDELSAPPQSPPGVRLRGVLLDAAPDSEIIIDSKAGDTLPTIQNTGAWLYRTAVPEPPTLVIIFACVVLKGGLR